MEPNERLNTMLVHANPVPDVNDIDLIDTGAAAYLELVQTRSSELAQIDTKRQSPSEPKRPVGTWLVAAVLIIVVGVAVILLAQSGDDAPLATQPGPSTVPESTPTTAPEVAPTTGVDSTPTTVSASEDPWTQLPTLAFAGGQGTYRTDSFAVPFSVTLPNGWISGGDEFDQVELSPTLVLCGFDPGQTDEQNAACRGVLSVTYFEGPTIDEILGVFGETEGIAPFDVNEVEVGGISTVWIEPAVTGDQPVVVRVDDEMDFLYRPDDRQRIYLVEVGKSKLMITVDDFEDGAFYTESQPILESIVWKEVG